MDDATRLKRLRIRAWRRGIRELDLLLGPFAEAQTATLELDAFERLLAENDTEVYDWFLERVSPPEEYAALLGQIRRFHAPG
ncbi:MAG TPA: succinate dehydrogenase assembly factor 2 [Amaricoccus sp.]|jgi:antitoxin CptB|nr:succinate dehydrogenase assembly factor 2 [Amaricoccus sp.]